MIHELTGSESEMTLKFRNIDHEVLPWVLHATIIILILGKLTRVLLPGIGYDQPRPETNIFEFT